MYFKEIWPPPAILAQIAELQHQLDVTQVIFKQINHVVPPEPESGQNIQFAPIPLTNNSTLRANNLIGAVPALLIYPPPTATEAAQPTLSAAIIETFQRLTLQFSSPDGRSFNADLNIINDPFNKEIYAGDRIGSWLPLTKPANRTGQSKPIEQVPVALIYFTKNYYDEITTSVNIIGLPGDFEAALDPNSHLLLTPEQIRAQIAQLESPPPAPETANSWVELLESNPGQFYHDAIMKLTKLTPVQDLHQYLGYIEGTDIKVLADLSSPQISLQIWPLDIGISRDDHTVRLTHNSGAAAKHEPGHSLTISFSLTGQELVVTLGSYLWDSPSSSSLPTIAADYINRYLLIGEILNQLTPHPHTPPAEPKPSRPKTKNELHHQSRPNNPWPSSLVTVYSSDAGSLPTKSSSGPKSTAERHAQNKKAGEAEKIKRRTKQK